MRQKKWKIKYADKELAAQLSQAYDLNPFLALILVSRGYRDSAAIAAFTEEKPQLVDPFCISGMREAAQRIRRALDTGERIAVYGDFDADGVTATALLSSFLETQGGNVITYIPDRETQGYGVHLEAIHTLAAQGVQLIITVDTGITAVEEVAEAATLGVDCVITDHHQPGSMLPAAVAVVDPHRDTDLPFADWAGVGVAFKLASAVYEGDAAELLADCSDLIAIGTVADLVPLKGENRLLVKAGLVSLNDSQRPGIAAFRQVTGMQERQFTSTDISFLLAPRINAAGRMERADTALELLLTEDYDHALLRAEQLCDYNAQRQSLEQGILEDIQKQLAACPEHLYDRVLVVDGPDYHNGVIGIVAARLVEQYGKPCIVLSNQPDGMARGSCRSVEGFSIFEALSACAADLERFGGHPMAAGLSLQTAQIDAFRAHINAYAKARFPVMPAPALTLDCRIAPAYLTLELLDDLALLEPFGAENEQPVFGLFHLQLQKVSPVGGGKHLRLELSKAGRLYQMMLFGVTQAQLPFAPGAMLDLAVRISRNVWNGRESVSIQICDIRPAGLDQERCHEERALYEAYCAGEAMDKEQLLTLLPGRAESAAVYRWMLQKKESSITLDHIYFALAAQGFSYGKLSVILTSFVQTGLAACRQGVYQLLPASDKVDLEQADIIIKLKGRVEHG